MVRPKRPLLMLLVYGALSGLAMAEDTTIGIETKLIRDPNDLSEPKNTKVEVNAAHTFANDVVVGGSFPIVDERRVELSSRGYTRLWLQADRLRFS